MMRLEKIVRRVLDRTSERYDRLSDAALWDIVERRTSAPNPAHRAHRRDVAHRELLFRAFTAGWPWEAVAVLRALDRRGITGNHLLRLLRHRPDVRSALGRARAIDTTRVVESTVERIIAAEAHILAARTFLRSIGDMMSDEEIDLHVRLWRRRRREAERVAIDDLTTPRRRGTRPPTPRPTKGDDERGATRKR